MLEIHPTDADARGIKDGDWVGITSRAGETVLRAVVAERMQAGVVYTTFHHPFSGANVITTDNSDWATNCPEYKVTAVEVTKVSQPSEWQQRYREFSRKQERVPGLTPSPRSDKRKPASAYGTDLARRLPSGARDIAEQQSRGL